MLKRHGYGYDPTTDRLNTPKVDTNGYQYFIGMNDLVPEAYDEIVLGYTGTQLTTVTYNLASVTVATLTLSYSGTTLTGVTKT